MILLAGDSWGHGDWDLESRRTTHSGLGQLIQNSGTAVISLAKDAGSNLESTARLRNFFKPANQTPHHIEKILIFQTAWTRDIWTGAIAELRNFVADYYMLRSRIVSRFYYELSKLSQAIDIPIYVIGGCSDTIWLDRFEQEYPGTHIACQSMTNLLACNDHRIQQPILDDWRFSWRTQLFLDLCKKSSSEADLEELTKDIDLGLLRQSQWQSLREKKLFLEDGYHPNSQGFQALYNFLKDSKILQ